MLTQPQSMPASVSTKNSAHTTDCSRIEAADEFRSIESWLSAWDLTAYMLSLSKGDIWWAWRDRRHRLFYLSSVKIVLGSVEQMQTTCALIFSPPLFGWMVGGISFAIILYPDHHHLAGAMVVAALPVERPRSVWGAVCCWREVAVSRVSLGPNAYVQSIRKYSIPFDLEWVFHECSSYPDIMHPSNQSVTIFCADNAASSSRTYGPRACGYAYEVVDG